MGRSATAVAFGFIRFGGQVEAVRRLHKGVQVGAVDLPDEYVQAHAERSSLAPKPATFCRTSSAEISEMGSSQRTVCSLRSNGPQRSTSVVGPKRVTLGVR